MCICVLIGNLSLNLSFSDFEALQQAHLLQSMGHSRQPSDSSIDKFVSRDEAAEPGDPENKVRHLGPRPLSIPSSHECSAVPWLLPVHQALGFPVAELLLSCLPFAY